jgi:hypothetical protein
MASLMRGKVVVVEGAGAQFPGVDTGLNGEQLVDQLLLGDLKAEKADRDALFGGDGWARFMTKVVLPMEGRAARMSRSEFWRPASMLSRSRKPVGRRGVCRSWSAAH